MSGATPNYRTVVLQDESLRGLQGFTQVPNVVLKHQAISFGAKVAFGVLLSYAWADDFCFPAQDRLAKDLDCSVRQVQRLLKELKDHSFIDWKQQGLNRPNVYYLLPMNRWTRLKPAEHQDTTDLSRPDTTAMTPPDATDRSPQDTTNSSPKEDSRKNTHTVVNRSANDHRSPVRPSAEPNARRISDRVLRATYRLTDDQIGRVHWLVKKQADVLGAVERNHRHYVKRAAEAVRDSDDAVLDQMLGELNQAANTIAVGSRPAYFHTMYTDALEKHLDETTPQPARGPIPGNRRHGPQAVRDLFRPAQDDQAVDPRIQMIADAERRGHSVPDHIRNADTSAVNRWWADLFEDTPSA